MSRKFEIRKQLYNEEKIRRKENNEPEQLPLREIPYSNRLKKNIKEVAKLHTKVSNIREHHHKKLASRLENTVRLLAMEEHSVGFMIRNRKQARAASDRAIGSFKGAIQSKMGLRYVPIGTSREGIGGNSQTCLCNMPVPKDLKERIHNCPNCGLIEKRDVVSANICMDVAFGYNLLKIPKEKKLSLEEVKIIKARMKKEIEEKLLKEKNKESSKKLEKVVWEAGHANQSLKTQIRGEVKVVEDKKILSKQRVKPKGYTSEISEKRRSELPKGCKNEGEESTSLAKTSCILTSKRLQSGLLSSEANIHLPTKKLVSK